MSGCDGMTVPDVLAVLEGLDRAGVRVWLEGGWAVDALVGRQTRPHRDLDLDIDVRQTDAALEALRTLGYRTDGDFRPNRLELTAPGRGLVDLHFLTFDDAGNAVQFGMAGEVYPCPAEAFVSGSLAGRRVHTLAAAQQIAWRTGYEMREVDRHDLALLRGLLGER